MIKPLFFYRFKKLLVWAMTAFLLLLCFAITSAHAYRITPSHVYQQTERLRLTLEQLNLLDVAAYEAEPPDTALRYPRHVMQKVRECHTVFSKLLESRSLHSDPLPSLYAAGEVKPADVKVGVEHLIKQLKKMAPAPVENPPFVDGKTPSDVYNNLKRLCHAVPVEIEPSDVFQVVSIVKNNIEKIAKSRGYIVPVDYNAAFEDKQPENVYVQTWTFLDLLRLLALNPDYAIPGGVIIPMKATIIEAKPQDVMGLMNDALSETNAIKYALGVHERTILPPYEAEKEPSDVFNQIYHATKLVRMLLELEDKFGTEKGKE